MTLISQQEFLEVADLQVNKVNIKEGSGAFLIEGSKGKESKTITVFYHRPKAFNKNAKILIVVPGAGRNADSYRDSWIEASEQYNVLILSPMYPEEYYGFEDYHMAGLFQNANLKEAVTFEANSNVAQLDEAILSFQINATPSTWLFPDFDRLFELVVKATGSTQTQYDLFGHSAGGQILHRLAIFHPDSKANRIIAANSGFYTLPNKELALPFGIKDTPIKEENLARSFQQKLVLFIGELDNENEQGGTLLRSPTVDQQGLHRLARGQYCYQFAKGKAAELGLPFNWKIEIVPKVGHNQQKMGQAAAKFLME